MIPSRIPAFASINQIHSPSVSEGRDGVWRGEGVAESAALCNIWTTSISLGKIHMPATTNEGLSRCLDEQKRRGKQATPLQVHSDQNVRVRECWGNSRTENSVCLFLCLVYQNLAVWMRLNGEPYDGWLMFYSVTHTHSHTLSTDVV